MNIRSTFPAFASVLMTAVQAQPAGAQQTSAESADDTAVQEVSTQLGRMLRRVEWAADRNRVKLEGVGFWVEMWVDAQAVHATGDIPIVGRLLGSPVASRLKQIVERTLRKQLP